MTMLKLSRQDIDELADDIAITAARIDAATHHLLTSIRRFDEARGWAAQGARTCAHWLSWRIGCRLGVAGEKLRVARALGKLPLIDAALKAGELSYCKVRAMTRVATADNEDLLLDQARGSTGAQLERVCRGLRRVVNHDIVGNETPPERYVRKRHTDDGMMKVEMQLLPDEAELLFKALHEQKALLRAERKTQDEGASPQRGDADLSAESSSTPPALADAVVALAEHRLAPPSKDLARPSSERRQLMVHLREERLQGAFQAELHDGTPLSGEALLRIACDADLVVAKTDEDGTVLDIGRKRRTVSPALARALRVRDRTCSFPGCACVAYLQAHHIEHWAQGGETSLQNLANLCHGHHVAIHEEGFRMQRTSDGALRFFDPRGKPIEPAPTPPTLHGDALQALAAQQQHAAIDIHRTTSLPRWNGTPLERHLAVDALVRRATPPQHGAS